jgi:cell division protein FtsB
VLTLAVGVVGLLLLNTSLQHGAFRAAALSAQATALLDRQQDLELRVAALRSPQSVAERARRLGMVANPDPVFLRLPDGRVLGRPRPAPPTPVSAPGPMLPDGVR